MIIALEIAGFIALAGAAVGVAIGLGYTAYLFITKKADDWLDSRVAR